MDTLPHRYLMLRASQFAPLRETLGGDVFVLSADVKSCLAHMMATKGTWHTFKMLLSASKERHRAMAQGNVLRTQARLGGRFKPRWLRRAYAHGKAKHAEFAEILISNTLARMRDPICLIRNGFNVPDSVVVDLAPAGRRIFLENGYFKGTIQTDPSGINFDNSLPRDTAFYRAYQPDSRPVDLVLNTRPAKHKTDAQAELPDRYIFVPFQVESDSQITQHSPWINDMRALYEVTFEMAEAHPDLQFVIKEHPNSRNVLHDDVPPHSRIIFQNGRSTEDLIKGATAVMTVNSTVGVEALACGRPVITLGNACYTIDGLVHHADSAQALKRLLADVSTLHFDRDLVARFLHYLYFEFLTPERGHWPGQNVHERLQGVAKRCAAVPVSTKAPPKAEREAARVLGSHPAENIG